MSESVIDLVAAQIERDESASAWLARWRMEMRAATFWECELLGVNHGSDMAVVSVSYEDCNGYEFPDAERLLVRLRMPALDFKWTPMGGLGLLEVIGPCPTQELLRDVRDAQQRERTADGDASAAEQDPGGPSCA
jgi:hypothetical protein